MTSTSFMVGLKSPNDTHKKSERHETCGSAPPARKAWSHEGPSDVADPRTGIRFAIDPPDWLEEPIAKRHTTLPKPFTSFGFSTQIPLQSWSNNANAQPSYGGLSSPTISFLNLIQFWYHGPDENKAEFGTKFSLQKDPL
ncbi:hypothetical protein V6N12_044219 [Hibiscus sabdariffa]|uniref:Uncharacterized protein n=1 Tax=Hibiscus sabdariffa TaxID=183260 RepID=A0ABR2DGL1_9ROSI